MFKLLISCSLSLFLVSSFAYEPLCESFFFNGSLYKTVNDPNLFPNAKTLLKIIKKSTNTREALRTLDKEYVKLHIHLQKSKDMTMKQLPPNIPQAEANKIMKALEARYIDINNEMIDVMVSIAKEKNLPISKKLTESFFDNKYYMLEFITDKKQKSSRAIEYIRRIKSLSDTEEVTVDLLKNMFMGSAGFSNRQAKRIDIGLRGYYNIVTDDILVMVGKHEAKHANFGQMRTQNKESIYHSSYRSLSPQHPLSNVDSGYQHFMSAEEIHNFANNLIWSSQRFINPTNYPFDELFLDLIMNNNYLFSGRNVFEQGLIISRKMNKKLLSQLKLSPDQREVGIQFFGESMSPAKTFNDAKFIGFVFPNGQIVTRFLSKELRKHAKKVFTTKEEILKNFNLTPESLSKLPPQEMNIVGTNILYKVHTDNLVEIELLIKSTIENQNKLTDVSEDLLEAIDEIIDLNLQISRNFEPLADTKQLPENLAPAFQSLRRKYKELGVIARNK